MSSGRPCFQALAETPPRPVSFSGSKFGADGEFPLSGRKSPRLYKACAIRIQIMQGPRQKCMQIPLLRPLTWETFLTSPPIASKPPNWWFGAFLGGPSPEQHATAVPSSPPSNSPLSWSAPLMIEQSTEPTSWREMSIVSY
jgi:hypothetical protein